MINFKLEDLGDANDPEVHEICGVEHYEAPRRKVLRMAREGAIPSASWEGKVWFHKPTLRAVMAPRRAQFSARLTGKVATTAAGVEGK